MPKFAIEPLARRHNRKTFSSGEHELDEWLKSYASQNAKKSLARTYVTIASGSVDVLGYYSVRAGEVATEKLTSTLRKNLPRYPVPVLHLARLAVHSESQGSGLGSLMLIDAMQRALKLSEELGLHAIEVRAISDAAASFYAHYGFEPLLDDEQHLYLPMKTIKRALK